MIKWHNNFIQPIDRYNLAVFVAVCVVIAIVVSSIAIKMISYQAIQTELSILVEEKDQLDTTLTALKKKHSHTVSQKDIIILQEKVQLIHELDLGQQLPTSYILSLLEEKLPPQAYLTELAYRQYEGKLLLKIEAKASKDLTMFLEALEQEGLFSKVLLEKKQKILRDGTERVQFEISLITTMKGEGGAL